MLKLALQSGVIEVDKEITNETDAFKELSLRTKDWELAWLSYSDNPEVVFNRTALDHFGQMVIRVTTLKLAESDLFVLLDGKMVILSNLWE